MKKTMLYITLLIGLGLLFSCTKEEQDPKLDMALTVKPVFAAPAANSSFVLTKPEAANILTTFTWSATSYSLDNLADIKYVLQMDVADSNFKNPVELVSTTGTSYEISVNAMNQKLIGPLMGLSADEAHNIAFRVIAGITSSSSYEDAYSEVLTLSITPYSTEVHVSPIYMLGDGTSAGWDNTKALEMTHIGEGGEYAVVDHLIPSLGVKFIADLGAWEPMWGLGATGTSESGDLKYRKVGDPDPPVIPSPAVEGDYRIVADTALLTYTITATSAQLFLVGDATTAGWNNANGIPFVKVSPGLFTLTTTLTAGGMKFLEVSGQWAPQWGTDAEGTSAFGNLVYRPTESVPDPINIVSPGAGTYTITLNLTTQTYTILAK
jgi:starch-binding outer membrane protein SusE/F